jgi:hypothetical protein
MFETSYLIKLAFTPDLGQAYNPRGSAIAMAKSEIAIKIGR